MSLFVSLRINTQNIKISTQEDIVCPPCNFDWPACKDMALILRSQDANGQFPPYKSFVQVRICARAITLAPN